MNRSFNLLNSAGVRFRVRISYILLLPPKRVTLPPPVIAVLLVPVGEEIDAPPVKPPTTSSSSFSVRLAAFGVVPGVTFPAFGIPV